MKYFREFDSLNKKVNYFLQYKYIRFQTIEVFSTKVILMLLILSSVTVATSCDQTSYGFTINITEISFTSEFYPFGDSRC